MERAYACCKTIPHAPYSRRPVEMPSNVQKCPSVTSGTSILLKVGLEENGGHDDVVSEAFEGLNDMKNMPQLSDSPERPSG